MNWRDLIELVGDLIGVACIFATLWLALTMAAAFN